MMRYEAVIWDCDGVLIDSEALACAVEVEALVKLGYNITLDDFLARFIGKSTAQIFSDIEEETGLSFKDRFPHHEVEARIAEVFTTSLQATSGIHDVLTALQVPMAVASGSSLPRLNQTLGLTNLLPYFKGHIYSAEMVKKGKPAPDVFLYAAEKLNVAPEKCVVIEDGVHGANGAKAAGMDVYGYVGGSHMRPLMKQRLADTGVKEILSDMRELLPLLGVHPQKRAG